MIRVLSACAYFVDALVDAEAEVNQMQRRGHAVHPCDEVIPGLSFGDRTQVTLVWTLGDKQGRVLRKCERSFPSHQCAEWSLKQKTVKVKHETWHCGHSSSIE